MSRSVRMVGAALIPAFALPLATGNVARAAVPSPPTNNNLPSELDIASPYVPQDTCDPVAKPGVLAFARLMANHYSEFNYGISRACTSGITEHSEGRALDWMLDAYDPHERAVADSVLAWLMAPDAQGRQGAMARRFGVMYVIWDRQIWGTYRMDDGWREYNGPNPHTDHIHFSFSWDGAMERTSWWTGKAWTGVSTAPDGPSVPLLPPTSYPTLREGASGPDVKLAQEVIGVTADGIFGPATRSALITWQRNHGVSATGVLDAATWDRMVALGEVPARGDATTQKTSYDTVRLGSTGESVKKLQRILGLSVDGIFGSRTDAAVREFQQKKSLKVNGIVDGNVWKALTGASYDKTGTTDTTSTDIPKTVRKGSTGSAVKQLQKILDISVDGIFGSQTESAVKAFQKKKSLRVDGVVGSNVWKALLGRSYDKTGTTDTTSTDIPKTVRKGSTGSAVKQLQKILGISVDGIFGSGTESAVKAFQKKKSLRVDGVVGSNVWKALLGRSYTKTGTTSDDTKDSSTDIPKTVRRGSTGSAVKQLQKILDISVDGIFGSGTESAVKAFQRKHSLTADGIVGAKTWEALLGKGSSTSGGSTDDDSSKDDSTKGSSTDIPKTVRRGSTGAAVKELQKILDISVDGIFGSGTESAVKAFQRKHSLTADGIVGEKTWRALKGTSSGGTQSVGFTVDTAAVRSRAAATVPTTTEFAQLKSVVLAEGARSAGVKQVQQVIGGIAVDGVFGAATAKAVRTFQTSAGLRATGVVDELTWDALEATKYPFLTYRTTVLRPGSSGLAVTALQSRLGVSADGDFGPDTERAVRALQERNGLTRTGYVGGVTWQALEREVRLPA